MCDIFQVLINPPFADWLTDTGYAWLAIQLAVWLWQTDTGWLTDCLVHWPSGTSQLTLLKEQRVCLALTCHCAWGVSFPQQPCHWAGDVHSSPVAPGSMCLPPPLSVQHGDLRSWPTSKSFPLSVFTSICNWRTAVVEISMTEWTSNSGCSGTFNSFKAFHVLRCGT